MTGFLDIETAVMDRLSDLAYTVSRTGTDLQQRVASSGAVIRVHRTGGKDSGWQVSARVTLETCAASREKAWETAEAAAERLLARGGFLSTGAVVDRVESESANAEMPYADQALRVVAATYRVTARRVALVP